MKLTKALENLFSFTALALALSACGDSVLGGGAGDGGAGGDGGSQSAGTGGGGSPMTSSGSTATGGGQACGGFTGQTCPAGSFCDYPDDLCGAVDGPGVCRVSPSACDDIYQPVCGCDGKVHANSCEAYGSGSDVAIQGCTLPAPVHLFQCGPFFCDSAKSYCLHSISDVVGEPDGYTCRPLPSSCQGPSGMPDCACLAGENCGNLCEVTPGDGLKLTCPGG
jgi:hypothetical protein